MQLPQVPFTFSNLENTSVFLLIPAIILSVIVFSVVIWYVVVPCWKGIQCVLNLIQVIFLILLIVVCVTLWYFYSQVADQLNDPMNLFNKVKGLQPKNI